MRSVIEKPIHVFLKGSEASSKNRGLVKFIKNNLTSNFTIHHTKNLETFLATLKHQSSSGSGTAVLCGGDGMVHHAVQLLAGTSIAVLPLPGGTANDLSRELGWCPLVRGSISTQRHNMDCLRVNSRLLATVGGCGHGAEVIRRIRAMRGNGLNSPEAPKRLGKWIYALVSAEASLHRARKKALYAIEYNGGSWEGCASSILVCNQGTLAGVFRVCRSSDNGDGLFEVLVSQPSAGVASLLDGLASILFRKPLAESAACFLSTKKARILDQSGLHGRFFADGELLPRPPDNEYRISVEPGILTVVRRV